MKYRRGFTLVEILIVVMILALTATFITVNIGDHRKADDDVERLRLTIEAAAEQAEILGTPLLIELLPQGYRFSRFDMRGNWVPIDDDPMFSQRNVAADIVWGQLELGGQTVAPKLTFSTGMPPFLLHITTPSGTMSLVGLPTGSVRASLEPKAVL